MGKFLKDASPSMKDTTFWLHSHHVRRLAILNKLIWAQYIDDL